MSETAITSEWTLDEGVELCRRIEAVCPMYGCHVGLTGGVLYKDGARKDLDLIFYRIRQEGEINAAGLFDQLEIMGIRIENRFGWVVKATYYDRSIDMMFPEFVPRQRARDDEDDGDPGEPRLVERVRFFDRFEMEDQFDPNDPGRYQ